MADKEIERIKLLYDYEKFHIGLYGGLIASFFAISKLWYVNLTPWDLALLKIAMFLLVVASISGAIIASSIIDIHKSYNIWDEKEGTEPSLTKLWSDKIGPFTFGVMTVRWWWILGHFSFWIAILAVVSNFLLKEILY